MIIILSIIIVLLLIVIYYLYVQNLALRNVNQKVVVNEIDEELEKEQAEGIDDEEFGKLEEELVEEVTDIHSLKSNDSDLENMKITKKQAIWVVNETLGRDELSNVNTNFSKLNKSKPVWWFNIPPLKFSNDLHLILEKKKGFFWIKIPKGTVKDVSKTFRIREDRSKDYVDIEITSELGIYYLRDVKSGGTGFNFEQYIEMEFD